VQGKIRKRIGANMIRPEEITGIIGCEESQAEANEFRALGFNVFSCDLKP
jgi:hypothetical protein